MIIMIINNLLLFTQDFNKGKFKIDKIKVIDYD